MVVKIFFEIEICVEDDVLLVEINEDGVSVEVEVEVDVVEV